MMPCCGIGAGETFVDKTNAVTGAIKEVLGVVGALATGKQPEPIVRTVDNKPVVVGKDYTPYVLAGVAVLGIAGFVAYKLYKKSRRPVIGNPRRRRSRKSRR